MDPNTAYRNMMGGYGAEPAERIEAAEALAAWLRRGGFLPHVGHVATRLEILAECDYVIDTMRAAIDHLAEIDDDHGTWSVIDDEGRTIAHTIGGPDRAAMMAEDAPVMIGARIIDPAGRTVSVFTAHGWVPTS